MNEFVMNKGGMKVDVDAGLNSNILQRLKLVQHFLESDEMFFANYSDDLSNLPLPELE